MLSHITSFLMASDEANLSSTSLPYYQLVQAWLFAMGMFLAPAVGTLAVSQSNRMFIGTQVMVRAELTAAIYRKAMRMSIRSRQATETGRVVNLMSADVNQLQSFLYPFASQVITGPVTMVVALVLLWFQIKWATFIGLGILLISTPITTIFLKKITGFRREMLKYTDQRVKLMNQLLVGIRVLKMYAWEAAQEAVVLEVRRKELGELGKAIPMRVGLQTILNAAPTLAMVACFGAYGTAAPNAFQPSNVFTAISLFALMRAPLFFLPFALIQMVNAMVSMRRLTQYFLLEDRNDTVNEMDDVGISIKEGEFFWAEPPPKLVMPEVGKKKKNKKSQSKGGARDGKSNPEKEEDIDDKKDVAKDDLESGKVTPTSSSSDAVLGKHDKLSEDEIDSGGLTIHLPSVSRPSSADKGIAWRLQNVNLVVKPGQLVCVVGRVGSGKSSLIQAILGEMEVEHGTVNVGGSVAYAAQQAWIVNATVKDNVSFGKPFDEERWKLCVDACCLASDLEILPAGEDTEIGEKGINLSGGQKQRISLARALYQDADLYILDDPLSAVDVHVGRHIFERFITGAISQKARLLVTNQLQYLPSADHIVVLDKGCVVVQGTYEECQSNAIFARLLAEHNSSSSSDPEVLDSAASDEASDRGETADNGNNVPMARMDSNAVHRRQVVAAAPGVPGVNDMRLERSVTFTNEPASTAPSSPPPGNGNEDNATKGVNPPGGLTSFQTMERELAKDAAKKAIDEVEKGGDGKGEVEKEEEKEKSEKKGGLIMVEDKEVGQVTGKVYWRYIIAYGVVPFVALIFFWSGEQAVRVLTSWYLSKWTAAESTASYVRQAEAAGVPLPPGVSASYNRMVYVGGYLGFALGYVLLTAMRSLMNLISSLRASRVIHFKALTTLIRAPVTFFDMTPVGRILNRFSKDTDDVDFLLSLSMSEFGSSLMQLLSTFIFLAVVQPIILAGVVPLLVIYYFLQRFYRRSYIEMQRLESVSRSPIYALFSESLTGVETIRAYRLTDAFSKGSDSRVDENHRAYFTSRMANEWLSLRLDLIGACIVFLSAVLAIVNRNVISASLAALTLSEALNVTLFLKSAVTSGANFETRFNSVERITAYWGLVQEAGAESSEEHKPDDNWPTDGALEYQDIWMKYRPGLDPVLKGVSFVVNPGDKVGIVGRTGSGKSSLIVTLFRLVEPFQGKIVLDGINLLDLGLDDVRGRIAAIPQDPILFSGTVRYNLDPFDRHSDAELWEALGHVALREVVAALPEGLSARVAEGGENFSVGQRQLLCVARALLRNPRVLVADEATASVDSETDALIQRTIRREFKHCTVLTIAHRINTIMDSTRVLVMEDGRVKEYDTVPTLVGRQDSTFRAMVVEAGLEGSASVSRSASGANLEGERRRLEGLNTFVNRLKNDYKLK